MAWKRPKAKEVKCEPSLKYENTSLQILSYALSFIEIFCLFNIN
jgi:hypothetical protein